MNVVENKIQELVQTELNSANEKFPLFNSPHEGYAVIKEELEECSENIFDMTSTLQLMWDGVKNNDAKTVADLVKDIRSFAVQAACEAVQVAAMCDKFSMSLEGEENG